MLRESTRLFVVSDVIGLLLGFALTATGLAASGALRFWLVDFGLSICGLTLLMIVAQVWRGFRHSLILILGLSFLMYCLFSNLMNAILGEGAGPEPVGVGERAEIVRFALVTLGVFVNGLFLARWLFPRVFPLSLRAAIWIGAPLVLGVLASIIIWGNDRWSAYTVADAVGGTLLGLVILGVTVSIVWYRTKLREDDGGNDRARGM